MHIKHIEKTTFVDYPGKISCTIFLYGCPFRCGFCYNPSLVLKEETPNISEQEVLEFLEKRVGLLEGVCFTGGEPLMNIEIDFLEKIKALGYFIKIDTNGSYPEKLKDLIDKKLVDYVAMDIKGPKEDYSEIVGVMFPMNRLEESIRVVSQFPNYEFRTTIIEKIHTKEKIESMLKWVTSLTKSKIKNFSLQGFKNHENFVDNKFK
ncbi:MAG: anaerobic ribonucleoside-triphosphate reductase activating protein, partial [archaeon]